MFSNRWIAYFDILGFSALVEKATHPDFILEIYNEALVLSQQDVQSAGLSRLHFSDTFIFYSTNDAPESYTWIQVVAKNFIRGCVCKYIPLRGAIAFGEFYADTTKGIFFGKALTEAYKEAESQNWIGLVLAKTAEEKVLEYELDPARHQFPIVNVPEKSKQPAYDFHRNGNNVDQVLRALVEMQKSSPSKDKSKYQNTIDYIKGRSAVATTHKD